MAFSCLLTGLPRSQDVQRLEMVHVDETAERHVAKLDFRRFDHDSVKALLQRRFVRFDGHLGQPIDQKASVMCNT